LPNIACGVRATSPGVRTPRWQSTRAASGISAIQLGLRANLDDPPAVYRDGDAGHNASVIHLTPAPLHRDGP
jgi:hypothetical protein